MSKVCRSCCSQPKYIFTSMMFYGCADVSSEGFTVSFYKGWSSGTTIPSGAPEHSETVSSLPYSYAPADPLSGYGILIQKTGWITQVDHAAQLGSADANIAWSLSPLTLALSTNGLPASATLTAQNLTSTSVFNGATLFAQYSTPSTDPNTFLLQHQFNCGGTIPVSMLQSNASSGFSAWSELVPAECVTPFDATFTYTLVPIASYTGNICTAPDSVGLVSSATVTL